ncbi:MULTISPECIES: very short patch repair endonuclease [unclassified Mesorhizobium]|uniref:very short patch repair endonuclease n=1 Tax=unclassified Mesorhizobium TaxID=325217 RepID=UPI0003CED962|nr:MULTISPECIES: very short patch repair endonuclease [unclassified Mesorhizobium]ESX31580.1 DNA glycosylase [Mesorhizobium sp. LSHC440B00]ESX39700.1 DNA glycosylase [Mesorhizobium sp. LSHC432A00]ESX44635.1 DNA glycosylase [Mesorhizobium sp. LSHC440A00]WJI58913.1 very short patch repair endonuclease [Mesorhizobium sp. C432A]
MADIVDKVTRSRMMSGIRGSNTKPEKELRAALHARGLRYRLHAKNLIGRPDLVFPKFHAAVFVHGCFWHRHEGCRYSTMPSTRREFWEQKFAANIARDRHVEQALLDTGWRVATVWECALKTRSQVVEVADRIWRWLGSHEQWLEVG